MIVMRQEKPFGACHPHGNFRTGFSTNPASSAQATLD
jgi:hypothetical protein